MYSNIGQKAVDSKLWRNIKDGFELRRLFLMVSLMVRDQSGQRKHLSQNRNSID